MKSLKGKRLEPIVVLGNGFPPRYNLHYIDKAAMSAGIEVRVPYLDKNLIEFSAAIPRGLKMKESETN